MQNSEEITWEDVIAVCKVLGVEYEFYEDLLDVRRPGNRWGSLFTRPADALEFITAPRHELEKP